MIFMLGQILGIPGKILAFCVSLICASLPITGFLIWKGRRKKKSQEYCEGDLYKKHSLCRGGVFRIISKAFLLFSVMVLIVDDKQENLYSLKQLLEIHGFNVDTAISGEEALKKTLKNFYALIILDVQMPEMDGFEVAEAITGYGKTKDIPIIFLSAVKINKTFITKGYDSGGIDYVTKPFDPDVLLLKVKTFYRLSEQRRQLNETQNALKEEIEIRKKAEMELSDLNHSLEQRVAERTEELYNINKQSSK